MRALESSNGVPWRATARHALLKIRWLASVPPSRWPWSWHAATCLLIVGAALAAAYSDGRGLALQVQQASNELTQLKVRLASLEEAGRRVSPSETTLPGPGHLDVVLRDMSEAAAQGAVKLASVRIERELARSGVVSQEIKLHAKASAEYGALKSWLSQLLARHSWLALGHASLRRSPSDGKQVDAEMTFVLFVRATP